MKLDTHKCNKPEHFIELYESLLDGKNPKRILEIGIQTGRSLRMWANAFPDAEVVGLDIEPPREAWPEQNIRIVIGSQGDESILRPLGLFDLVVDDGNHKTSHQINTLNVLWSQLNQGGYYVMEDTETSELPEYVDTLMTATEYLKSVGFTMDDRIAYKQKI